MFALCERCSQNADIVTHIKRETTGTYRKLCPLSNMGTSLKGKNFTGRGFTLDDDDLHYT